MNNVNEEDPNRREWLRQAAIGAAGLSAGIATGCSGTHMVQVICHGTMVFKLPPPSSIHKGYPSRPEIEIHVPDVTATDGMGGHIYRAGSLAEIRRKYDENNLDRGTYKLIVTPEVPEGRPFPEGLTNTSLIFLHSDDGSCKSEIPKSGQQAYCIVKIPMPDDYQGYCYRQNGGQPIFKATGNDAMHCSFNSGAGPQTLNTLTTTPLVHVFRYHDVKKARLQEESPNSGNRWESSGSDNLLIYAQPATLMKPHQGLPNDHLKQLEAYIGLTTDDLDFNDSKVTVIVDPDPYVHSEYLQPLAAFGPNPPRDPILFNETIADCISVYGS